MKSIRWILAVGVFMAGAAALLAQSGATSPATTDLKQEHDQKAAAAEAEQPPTWTDPRTGLMWARKDNGEDVAWAQAKDYCENLTLAGYSNWRLPEIDELAAIYDHTQNVNGWHIKGGIQLTGWSWANTAGQNSTEAWFFGFNDGTRASVRNEDGRLRALCVRRSEPLQPGNR